MRDPAVDRREVGLFTRESTTIFSLVIAKIARDLAKVFTQVGVMWLFTSTCCVHIMTGLPEKVGVNNEKLSFVGQIDIEITPRCT